LIFYESTSTLVVIKLINELEDTYKKVSFNPHFQIKYKSYKSIPLKKFLIILIFDFDENNKEIKILSCFHTSRSTKKYPK
jgi:hypothetical protein